MYESNVPQFSDEAKQEFAKLTLDFFCKHISAEELENLEVEVKFKGKGRSEPAMFRVGCFQGEGPGCGPGLRWDRG